MIILVITHAVCTTIHWRITECKGKAGVPVPSCPYSPQLEQGYERSHARMPHARERVWTTRAGQAHSLVSAVRSGECALPMLSLRV